MSTSRARLFSDDGIDSSQTRFEPSYAYYPDESTLDEIKYLFTTLESTQRSSDVNGTAIDINNMPFSADLALLIPDGNGKVLSISDVINGMCRIATHFISRHELIQSRTNAYLRCKLAGAEMMLNGIVQSQSEQSVERDQILLSSVTVPCSPRDHSNESSLLRIQRSEFSNLSEYTGDRAYQQAPALSNNHNISSNHINDHTAPPPTTLFRSKSVRHEQLNSFAPNIFALDDQSLSATLNFLPEVFAGSSSFSSRKALSEYDADRLSELFEFFDFDSDGIVTRDDLVLGFTNIAKNFLSTDEFTQLLTNSYIQRKIRRAIYAIGAYQTSQSAMDANIGLDDDACSVTGSLAGTVVSSSALVQFEAGSKAVYTDEEGNLHVAEIIRLSPSQMAGSDAYHIETKGVKLHVLVHRLRHISPQDELLIEKLQSVNGTSSGLNEEEGSCAVNGSPTREYQLISQLSKSRLQVPQSPGDYNNNNNSNSSSSNKYSASKPDTKQAVEVPVLAVPHEQQQQVPQSNSNKGSSGGGGIFGYLKSSVGGMLGVVSSGTSSSSFGSGNGNNSGGSGNRKNSITAVSSSENSGKKPTEQSGKVDAPQLAKIGSTSAKKNNGSSASSNAVMVLEVQGSGKQMDGNGDNKKITLLQSINHDINNISNENSSNMAANTQNNSFVAPGDEEGDGEEGNGDGEEGPESALILPTTAICAPSSSSSSLAEAPHAPSSSASVSASVASASDRLAQAAALLAMDGRILAQVRKATSASYRLTRTMVPKPKKVEPYPIYFNRGKNGFFEFNQIDFGIQFTPFLRDMIPAQDPLWDACAESLSETNRCFFLHFGVAMGMHPYSLQQCFRNAAAELLKFPENEMTIFFGEALESLLLRNDFVDAQVLSAIWPLEFDKFKILIVRVDHNGRIESFTSFRSEAGPVDEFGEWSGEELIFTLQWNHFTILKPKSEQLHRPITAVLAAASMIGIMPLEFITKVPTDPAQRFKIC